MFDEQELEKSTTNLSSASSENVRTRERLISSSCEQAERAPENKKQELEKSTTNLSSASSENVRIRERLISSRCEQAERAPENKKVSPVLIV
ncbi:hypothetical protein CDAR_389001 [Caerostris darwini]|uniref:Uncharacterized protein n=1 Tax=Caerostris darwini TaxID=1538125 RepID=A0AAV4S916_9ARAC|nr:hypothetical protein CDAR_389001 [Caerostris darwini]